MNLPEIYPRFEQLSEMLDDWSAHSLLNELTHLMSDKDFEKFYKHIKKEWPLD